MNFFQENRGGALKVRVGGSVVFEGITKFTDVSVRTIYIGPNWYDEIEVKGGAIYNKVSALQRRCYCAYPSIHALTEFYNGRNFMPASVPWVRLVSNVFAECSEKQYLLSVVVGHTSIDFRVDNIKNTRVHITASFRMFMLDCLPA